MYAALHTHSCYSLLDGVPPPDQLAGQAARLSIPAIALTDHDAVYGAIPFAQACAAAGITPLIGAEMTVAGLLDPGDGRPGRHAHLTLLAMNRAGYANLCRLITLARANAAKGGALLESCHLAGHAGGLICLSGCLDSGPVAVAIRARRYDRAQQIAAGLRNWFGDRLYIELQRNYRREDYRITRQLIDLAGELRLPVVATPNAHYLHPADAPLHDVLRSIGARLPLHRAQDILRANAEFYLRSPGDMRALYPDCPRALDATLDIAGRCDFQLLTELGRHTLPRWEGDARQALRILCERGLAERYTGQAPARAGAQLDRELDLIGRLGLDDYFLMIWDVVRWARERRILCQGRGSAANSLVAYLLGITSIDPLASGLVFERFLSEERATPPDIDLDFSARRREEVIQYVYARYGRDRAAMVCTFNTFGARSAVRDAGFALGFPGATLDEIAAAIDQRHAAGIDESEALQHAFAGKVHQPAWQHLFSLAARLDGLPRHLGIHVGGMIVTGAPLTDLAPVEPAAMEDRTVIQWDRDMVESAGMVKVDLLSLRTLSAIEDSLDQVERVTGRRPDLAGAGCADRRVYDLICRGETLGIFQIESRAQAGVIPRMQPRCLADLAVQVALIRPGPIQGNMVQPYLLRRTGRAPVAYAHPLLRPALQETLGVIVFQEQVIKLAQDVAGFSAGRGELLRRALGNKRSAELIETFRAEFMAGARRNAVPDGVAHQVFEQLRAFGGYSFPKSHAASFALITYWHAWLRAWHKAAFFCGILRNEPMGFYPVSSVMADAQRAGVRLLHPDVNSSDSLPILERSPAGGQAEPAIRLGLASVAGVGEETARAVVQARGSRPFAGLDDVISRTGLDRRAAEELILAGALDAFGDRRQLIWDLVAAFEARDGRRLSLRSPDEDAALRPFTPREKLHTELLALGGLVDAHLMDLRAEQYAALKLTPSAMLRQLKHGARVRVGGVNTARQRPPAARGVCFLAVEDRCGMMNVVVPPPVYERDRAAIRSPFVVVDGTLQRDGGGVNILAEHVRAV